MAAPVEKKRYTVNEYLQRERLARDKHEYHNGEIFMMSGGTRNHSLIIANMIGELHARLKGRPCHVYDSNLRVRIRTAASYMYPDLTVICGEPNNDLDDPFKETITNPRLVVEVVSPSTEAYDRSAKFNLYRAIESLQEYVVVMQDSPRIETFYRQPGGSWLMTPISGLDKTTLLRSIEIELLLKDIYAGVEFTPEAPPTP